MCECVNPDYIGTGRVNCRISGTVFNNVKEKEIYESDQKIINIIYGVSVNPYAVFCSNSSMGSDTRCKCKN